MVNRTNNDAKINSISFAETGTSSGRQRHSRKHNSTPPIDDVIISLADAYENRRARQVSEWVSRQNAPQIFNA